jgi:glycosyltransferase involved in cell wall biosynthesis
MPTARLALIGLGENAYIQKMKALASDLGIGGVVDFAGARTGAAKYAMLKAARIMVHPSHEESFGYAMLEGMACGLPVVAYDLPVYRAIFRAGMVTAPLHDYNRLAEQILALLTDDARRNSLAAQAREFAETRDQATLLKEFMEK